jgi:drug/metabolite transporter (DMT)-like permease
MDAVLLACLAAFGFGALAVAVRVGFRRVDDPLLAALSITTVGAASVALVAAAAGAFVGFDLADAAVFAGIGALVPGLSQLLFVRAVRDAGPSRAAIAIGTAPIFSAALAVAFLDEPLGPALAIATLLIVAGGALLAWEPARPAGFRMLGVVFALVCALLFAVRDNLVREAADRGDLAPLAATTATLVGALLALGAVALVTRAGVRARPPLTTIAAAFVPAGLCLGLAYAALVEAFDRGRVTVVAPLNATQSLWAVLLAALVLGRSEAIGRRLVLAAVLVVAGGVLIGITR